METATATPSVDDFDRQLVPLPVPEPMTLQELRRDIRLACISSFATNFLGYFGYDLDIEKLETELLTTTTWTYSEQFAANLVQSLSNERSMNTDNYLPRLRREFIRKEKTWTKLGNDRYAPGEEDGPIPWSCLSSTDKIHAIWRLCEWHCWDAERMRNRMGTDDEIAWRDEPIGWDAYGHAYWYFYDGRLWRQRIVQPLDKPERKPERKSVAAAPSTSKAKSKSKKAPAPKRKRPLTPPNEAEERNSPVKPASATKRQKLGVRSSRRLDGAEEDNDGWQAIPEEWLAGEKEAKAEESDGGISSSSLSSVSEVEARSRAGRVQGKLKASKAVSTAGEESEMDFEQEPDPLIDDPLSPDDPVWIEWEVVCAKAEEWEALSATLATFKHGNAKALRAFIDKEALPNIREDEEAKAAEALAEAKAEAKARVEAIKLAEVTMPRKRSTRIATKESAYDEFMRLEDAREANERHARRLGGRTTRELSGTPFDDSTREGRLKLREEQRKEKELQDALAQLEENEEEVGEDEGDEYVDDDDAAPAVDTTSLKVTLKRSPTLPSTELSPNLETQPLPGLNGEERSHPIEHPERRYADVYQRLGYLNDHGPLQFDFSTRWLATHGDKAARMGQQRAHAAWQQWQAEQLRKAHAG